MLILSHLLLNAPQPTQYNTKKDRDVKFRRFQETLKSLDKRNAAEKAANGTAVFGINMMADLSPLEFELKYLGMEVPSESERRLMKVVDVAAFKGESHSADWRGKYTTPVKNQGGCGTCW